MCAHDWVTTENKTILKDLYCLDALKLQNTFIQHTFHPPTYLHFLSYCKRGSCEQSKLPLYEKNVLSPCLGIVKRSSALPTTLGINENQIRENDTKFENSPRPGVNYQNVSLIQLYETIG